MSILVVFAGVIFLCIVILAVMYNGFIVKKNNVDYAFAGIDAQLKKRCDLIPNLVATVKTYMTHENKTLTEIAELRSRAMAPNISNDEKTEIAGGMTNAMRQIMVQVERYPDLKANTNFQQLQRTLNEVEEQLSASRRAYNGAVTEFNNAIQMFPGNIFASVFGFKARQLFAATESERANPNVSKLFE